jgi:hypothetical protein
VKPLNFKTEDDRLLYAEKLAREQLKSYMKEKIDSIIC